MKVGLLAIPLILLGVTQTGVAATQQGFKRFSVSAGWLHVMPQGKANSFNINTDVANGMRANVGMISGDTILNNIDQAKYDELEATDPYNMNNIIFKSYSHSNYRCNILCSSTHTSFLSATVI